MIPELSIYLILCKKLKFSHCCSGSSNLKLYILLCFPYSSPRTLISCSKLNPGVIQLYKTTNESKQATGEMAWWERNLFPGTVVLIQMRPPLHLLFMAKVCIWGSDHKFPASCILALYPCIKKRLILFLYAYWTLVPTCLTAII